MSQSDDTNETSNSLTTTIMNSNLYPTWSSIRNLLPHEIMKILLEKNIDVRESLNELLRDGKVADIRYSNKNLEIVWKNKISEGLINSRNTRL